MRSEPPLIAYFITFYQSQVKRRQFLWEMVCFFFLQLINLVLDCRELLVS